MSGNAGTEGDGTEQLAGRTAWLIGGDDGPRTDLAADSLRNLRPGLLAQYAKVE